MKAGLPTSLFLHAALLGYGLLTLSAPSGYEVADVEALPIDIIPVESITQVQQGEREAPMAETPAPKPTSRPEIVEDARIAGEETVETKALPAPEEKPKEVQTASVPPPSPKPEPVPVPKAEPEPVEKVEPKPEPVPATEVTPAPQPKQEVAPEPVEKPAVAETAEAESVPLPESAPAPEARPQPPKAQTAKAPERKVAEKPVVEKAAPKQSTEKEFDADEVAMLLNKEKASGGGAKRSTQTAALGGKETTGAKLSQGEMDALRNQLSGCWTIPAGAEGLEGLRVSVRFTLDGSGRLEGRPTVSQASGNRSFDDSAVRAIQICNSRGLQLPLDKPEVWASGVTVNFDPSEMF